MKKRINLLLALTPLVPRCTGPGGICTYCDFLVMGQNVIKFLMFIAIPLAVIFIIYGGVMLMLSGGSPQRAGNAKKILTNAIIGVTIALGAWIIVNTIFVVLAQGNIAQNWWKINCNPVRP